MHGDLQSQCCHIYAIGSCVEGKDWKVDFSFDRIWSNIWIGQSCKRMGNNRFHCGAVKWFNWYVKLVPSTLFLDRLVRTHGCVIGLVIILPRGGGGEGGQVLSLLSQLYHIILTINQNMRQFWRDYSCWRKLKVMLLKLWVIHYWWSINCESMNARMMSWEFIMWNITSWWRSSRWFLWSIFPRNIMLKPMI